MIRLSAAAAIFALSLPAVAAPKDAVDFATPGIPPLRDRARFQDEMLKERLDTLIPGLMRANKVDMWILVAREYNEDPVVRTMLPAVWPNARRRTVLVFFDRGGGKGVERFAVARYPIGDVFPSAWGPETQPDQWARIAELVRERNPKQIAINISDAFPLADGLSVSQYRKLIQVLGPLASRLVSHDGLAVGWLETRTPREMATYRTIMRTAHAVIAEGLSEKVITPGVTTSEDVVWWYRERLAELKIDAWCQPSLNVQRASVAKFDIGKIPLGNADTIQAGDLLHVDFCTGYMGLKTDTQQMAYVLRPAETEAPKGMRDGLTAANRVQDALVSEFRNGSTGNEVLARARKKAIGWGLNPTIYTHPIGYTGHGAGASIGTWEHQNPTTEGPGDYPMSANTAWSIELAANQKVPEWGEQDARFMLEVDGFWDGKTFKYIEGRQTELHLIPRQR